MPTCDLCGKTFDKQGKLNLHRYHCELKQLKTGGQAAVKVVKLPDNCDHDLRLLNPKNSNEYQAMQHGYTEVCVKCQELQ